MILWCRFALLIGSSLVLILTGSFIISISRTTREMPKSSKRSVFDALLTKNNFPYFNDSDGCSAIVNYSFPHDAWYYYNDTAYDYYSFLEMRRTKPLPHWKTFSLNSLKQYTNYRSPSGLAFVESIMIITGKHLKIRHKHMEHLLSRQGIPKSALEYRWKWNKENCADPSNFEYIKTIFPYNFGNHTTDLGCSTIMEHIDAWYSVAKRNLSFALILEDDVAFVPFLKEKFNRFMAEAVKLQLIKVGEKRDACSSFSSHVNFSIDCLLKNPLLTEGIFHFGACRNDADSPPNETSLRQIPSFKPYRKYSYGRCAHMYGMTHCAAKIMINILHQFPPRYQWLDWLLNYVITRSPNLMGWWPNPPLGYQIKEMEVIGELDPLLKGRTYTSPDAEAIT